MTEQHQPLPISKPTRVWLEAIRTASSVLGAAVSLAVLLRVFGIA